MADSLKILQTTKNFKALEKSQKEAAKRAGVEIKHWM